MATIHSLPPELILDILDWAGPQRSLALVCRDWREPAQRRLFELVQLGSHAQVAAYLHSPARSRYPPAHLFLPDEHDMSPWDIVGEGLLSLDPGKDEYEWAMSQQATAVKGFVLTYTEEIPPDAHPILQHLRWLDIYGPVNMEVSALDALLSESRNTLSTLTVIWWCGSFLGTSDPLLAFFTRVPFTSLQSLIIDGSADIIPSPSALFASLPALISLKLDCVDLAVVASSPPQLEILTVERFKPSRAKLTELLRIIRLPNLASLRHLNLPGLQKPELSNPYGVALLEECEDRTIVFRCRYGYMTLAHLLEADDI